LSPGLFLLRCNAMLRFNIWLIAVAAAGSLGER